MTDSQGFVTARFTTPRFVAIEPTGSRDRGGVDVARDDRGDLQTDR